jgi:hypothetical protein
MGGRSSPTPPLEEGEQQQGSTRCSQDAAADAPPGTSAAGAHAINMQRHEQQQPQQHDPLAACLPPRHRHVSHPGDSLEDRHVVRLPTGDVEVTVGEDEPEK